VEAQTEKVWRQADEWNLSRIVYVNKMDRVGAGFGRTIRDMIIRLKARPLVIQLPLFEKGLDGGALQGVVDLVSLRAYIGPISPVDFSQGLVVNVEDLSDNVVRREIRRARTAMLDTLAELDDEFLELYLEKSEDEEIHLSSIQKTIRSLTLRQVIVPVLCGASLRDIGIHTLLDAIKNYLPSPTDLPPPIAEVVSEPRRVSLEQIPGHLCALAFKVLFDAVLGPLVFVRVYRGSLVKGMTLINARSREAEKPTRLLRMYADESLDLMSIDEGDIGVLLGMKHTVTGDTILSKRVFPLLQLQPMAIPPSVFITSIEPDSLGETKTVSDALQKLLREDPSLSVSIDEDSGQILLGGMGELHLEIAFKKLIKDFSAKCSMSKVRISYRETIAPELECTVNRIYDRQINGKSTLFGLAVTVSGLSQIDSNRPVKYFRRFLEHGNVIEIDLSQMHSVTDIDEDQTAQAVYSGSRAALQSVSKFQLPFHSVLVRVANLQGFEKLTTFQSVFSASRQATQEALHKAIASAGPSFMEPYMKLSVTVPDGVVGDVIGDLTSSKRGIILSLISKEHSDGPNSAALKDSVYIPSDSTLCDSSHEPDTFVTISARVPLKEMIGYDKTLRSISQGRGTFIMSLEGFERMTSERSLKTLHQLTGTDS
jgi:elongation factor G